MEKTKSLLVLPRLKEADETPPAKIREYLPTSASVGAYLRTLLKVLNRSSYDLVICGHINLLPFARLAQVYSRGPLILVIHGIDVAEAKHRFGLRYLARRVDLLISVSKVTLDQFLDWAPLVKGKHVILPNSVDLDALTPGPKPTALLDRYDLHGKKVLLTLGRLAGRDRQKGFDEVLEIMPKMVEERPDIVYMIAGDGPDKQRLVAKAERLGIKDNVVFTGRITDKEKEGHYRLADVYVMPSRGEGFGIVILEALACGLPVIGSKLDGTREALLDGRLGKLVDPGSKKELIEKIFESLRHGRRAPSGALKIFSRKEVNSRTQKIIATL